MLSLGNLEELTNIFIGNAFFKVYMEIFPNSLEDFNFYVAVLCIYMGQISVRTSQAEVMSCSVASDLGFSF